MTAAGAYSSLPENVRTELYDELEDILGIKAICGEGLGLRAQHPAHPVIAFGIPSMNGSVMPTQRIGHGEGDTITHGRTAHAYNFDGAYQRFVDVPLDMPRVWGARTAVNYIENMNGWSTTSGTITDVSGEDGVVTITMGSTAGAESHGVFATSHPTRPLYSASTVGRLLIAAFDVKAGEAAAVGKAVSVSARGVSGGSGKAETSGVQLTNDWQRVVSPVFEMSAGYTGVFGSVFPSLTNGATSVSVQVRRGTIEFVDHRTPRPSDGDYVPPSEWEGHGSESSGTETPLRRVEARIGYYWRELANTVDPATGIVTERECSQGRALHPLNNVDGLAVFADIPPIARNTEYAEGAVVLPDGLRPYNDGASGAAYDQTSVYLRCVTAGTTHASNTINGSLWTITGDPIGETITDGSVVWLVEGRAARDLIGYVGEHSQANQIDATYDSRDASTWTDAGGTTTDTAIGIDGLEEEIELTDGNAGFATYMHVQDLTVVGNDETWTGSVFCRKQETTNQYPAIYFNFTGGTGVGHLINFDPRTGATYDHATLNTGNVFVEDWGDFWRFVIQLTNNATGNTNATLRVYPARGTTTTGNEASAQGSQVFDFPQIEEANYATSPIWCKSAVTTRTADELEIADTWSDEFDADPPTQGMARFQLCRLSHGHTGTSRRTLYPGSVVVQLTTSLSNPQLQSSDGTNFVSISDREGDTPEDLHAGTHSPLAVAVAYSLADADAGAAQQRLSAIGAAGGATYDGAWAAAGVALQIGHANSVGHLGGVLSGILLWKVPLIRDEDAALEELTARDG